MKEAPLPKENLFELLSFLEQSQRLVWIDIENSMICEKDYLKILQFLGASVHKKPARISFVELLHPLERNKLSETLDLTKIRGKTEKEISFLIGDKTYKCSCLIQALSPVFQRLFIFSSKSENEWGKSALERQKLMNLGALSTSIAHDLSNLQSSMLCSTALLRKGEKVETIVEILEKSIQRSNELNQSILEYARGNTKQSCPNPVENIKKWTELLKKSLKPGQKFIFKAGFESKPIKITNSELGQVLFNLFFNAKDAIEENADSISLECGYVKENQKEYFFLEISDNGHGIKKEDIGKIFLNSFSSKKKTYKSGLGLFIVERIVSECGGWVDVHSEPYVCTQFKIFIPVSEEASL